MNFIITARCENGHSQEIRFDGSLGQGYVENVAGLMDGTSSMYLHSPIGTDSVIGKCGICKAQIACAVTDCEPSQEDQGGGVS